MSFERLSARGADIGRRGAEQARDRIVRRAELPADVTVSSDNNGIILTGKRLRRRLIEDPKLRNFAR